MRFRLRERGYSLIELLVVLAIVGILVGVGFNRFGDEKGKAVRTMMDQMTGVLQQAQERSRLTLGNVTIATAGTWTSGTNPLYLDYARTDGTGDGVFKSLYVTAQGQHVYQDAGVDDATTNGYATALGGATDLPSVPTISADTILTAAANSANIFSGASTPNTAVQVNGYTRRFSTGFKVVIVGLKSGQTYSGAPIGVILVPVGGVGVLKFYKGTNETTWRRL